MVEILISDGFRVFKPIVKNDITWETERKGSPGKLTFTVIKDDVINFFEGDHVRLDVDGISLFYGFVFKKTRDKDHHIKVVAYDQLRYLKNKISWTYKGKKASDLLPFIAEAYHLQLGEIEDTGYVISERTEDSSTMFDIILSALDLTLINTRKMFVLFDDFGKITLKSLANMQTNVLIDAETGENFDYTSSIDDNTYNQIVISHKNEETGQSTKYVRNDPQNITRWGVLQYYDTVKNEENAGAKADSLLKLLNVKTRTLKIKNVIGNIQVRAGKMVFVNMDVGDIKICNNMLVESCKHTFQNSAHFMTLTLRGGDIIE